MFSYKIYKIKLTTSEKKKLKDVIFETTTLIAEKKQLFQNHGFLSTPLKHMT